MSKKRNSSQAVTIKNKKCVMEVKVTNQFSRMMLKALKATLIVLKRREDDLSEDKWGEKQQNEFYEIFKVRHDVLLTIDSKEEKKKAKHLDDLTPRDPYIEKRDNITTYLFLKESIGRMIAICEKLSVENKKDSNERTHGNFINITDSPYASASVVADQTTNLNPESYGGTLKIYIYQKFACKPLSGKYSQVSTLCHELSHFYRHGVEGEYGGMGTDDIPVRLGDKSESGYLEKARDLKNEHSQYVFKNAYNIEQYFELKLSNEDLLEIESYR
jgi:hypothetical protein